MKDKLGVFVLLVLLIGLLTACGGSGESADTAAIAAGEALFNQTIIGANAGCITCHSLEAEVVIVGPSMAGFAHEAEEEAEDLGMSAEEFVRQSIVDPNAVVPEGFPADTMPKDWNTVLTTEQIDSLVAFIMSQE